MTNDVSLHDERVMQACEWLKAHSRSPVALAKRTSNLFRDRAAAPRERLNLGSMNHVLGLDPHAAWVDVEGSTTYESLVASCLPHGVMPAVVPQLKDDHGRWCRRRCRHRGDIVS